MFDVISDAILISFITIFVCVGFGLFFALKQDFKDKSSINR